MYAVVVVAAASVECVVVKVVEIESAFVAVVHVVESRYADVAADDQVVGVELADVVMCVAAVVEIEYGVIVGQLGAVRLHYSADCS